MAKKINYEVIDQMFAAQLSMIHDWDRLFAGFRRVDPFEAAAEERNKYYDPFIEREGR